MSTHPGCATMAPIERIVLPLVGRANPAKRIVVAFACYLDDSGTDPQSTVVTVAGFVAPISAWIDFERAAVKVFLANGIARLHTVDFHQGRAEFANWTLARKHAFAEDLAAILFPLYPIGVSVSVSKLAIIDRKKESGLWPSMSPFGCGFFRLVQLLHSKVFEEIPQLNKIDSADLSLVMEAGNKNNQEALIAFTYLKKSLYARNLNSMSFGDKDSSYAIQVADFLAYYTRRWMDKCNSAGNKVEKPKILNLFSERLRIHSETITDIANFVDGTLPSGSDWVLSASGLRHS